MFNETSKRSFLKTLTWRIIIFITDFILAFVLTGRVEVASGFAFAKFLLGFILYFAHERAWNLVSWGKS